MKEAFTLNAACLDAEAVVAGDLETQVRLVHVSPLSVSGGGQVFVRTKTCTFSNRTNKTETHLSNQGEFIKTVGSKLFHVMAPQQHLLLAGDPHRKPTIQTSTFRMFISSNVQYCYICL